MKESAVSQNARKYFESGLNCAESVLRSVVEHVEESQSGALYRLATPFGGGVGGSHEELCGAMSGGVMAVGYFTGRDHAEEDAAPSKAIAAVLRERFQDQYGCTQCGAILDKMGPQASSEKCAALVAITADLVMSLLEEENFIQ